MKSKFFERWVVPSLCLVMAILAWFAPMPFFFPTRFLAIERGIIIFLLGVGFFVYTRLSEERWGLKALLYAAYVAIVVLISGPIAALLI